MPPIQITMSAQLKQIKLRALRPAVSRLDHVEVERGSKPRFQCLWSA